VSEMSTSTQLNDDFYQSQFIEKIRLREIMLSEKNQQLEKQLALLTTLPVTNDYETIQLNSCNIDDLVIAVYSEEYGSYRIIHKSSNYLHFVHSAIFSSHEQRLSFKATGTGNTSTSGGDQKLPTSEDASANEKVKEKEPSNNIDDSQRMIDTNQSNHNTTTAISCSIVKNSPMENVDDIFMSEQQPAWFIGRVLVKEFCVARKVNDLKTFFCFFSFSFYSLLLLILLISRRIIDLKCQVLPGFIVSN
jgi:hypothetical protein